MTTTLTATFDGKALIPVGPVDLPKGTTLRVQVQIDSDTAHPLRTLAELVQSLPASPGPKTDGAGQHDHYLYGAPKQS